MEDYYFLTRKKNCIKNVFSPPPPWLFWVKEGAGDERKGAVYESWIIWNMGGNMLKILSPEDYYWNMMKPVMFPQPPPSYDP